MIKDIYVIFDKVKGLYMYPHYAINKTLAQREFLLATSNLDEKTGQEATDFELFKLGTYNDETGEIKVEQKEFICKGQLIEKYKQNR